MCDGVSARPFVVPAQTFIEILRDSNVMPRWFAVAAQNVDESPADALHGAKAQAGFGPKEGPPSRSCLRGCAASARRLRRDSLRLSVSSLRGGGPPSRLR